MARREDHEVKDMWGIEKKKNCSSYSEWSETRGDALSPLLFNWFIICYEEGSSEMGDGAREGGREIQLN